jgi:prefoldin alpha subunit
MEEHNHEHSHNSSENNEELALRASFLEKHLQEVAEKLEYLSNQISEFEDFRNNLDFLSKSEEKKMFSSLGKGVYLKSSLEDSQLFVNIGAGIVLRKTPEETKAIIESNIKQFHEVKAHLMAQIEVYNSMLSGTLSEIENLQAKK